MGTLLKVVGAVWAIIGGGNLVGMPWAESSQSVLMFGLMFNMLLFVIPGLIVYGIGSGIKKKQNKATEQVENGSKCESNVESRLIQLEMEQKRYSGGGGVEGDAGAQSFTIYQKYHKDSLALNCQLAIILKGAWCSSRYSSGGMSSLLIGVCLFLATPIWLSIRKQPGLLELEKG